MTNFGSQCVQVLSEMLPFKRNPTHIIDGNYLTGNITSLTIFGSQCVSVLSEMLPFREYVVSSKVWTPLVL